ncbi:MAG: MFS transporter [Alphaproteobacteria bacterium]
MIGYAAFLIPSGWVAGKWGPRKTLTAGLIWWGVATIATALVPPGMAGALWVLMAVRFTLGLGEALAYPSANQFIAAWFPSAERGKANAWVQGGAQFGSGVAPPLVTFIILQFGWHAAFFASAAIGLMIAVLWYNAARDLPAQHPSVTPQEMAHIQAGLPVAIGETRPPVPWGRIFGSKDTWGTALAYFGFGYAATIFSTWFFIYLKEGRGFDMKASAVLGMLPFIATTTCCLLGGAVSDGLVKRYSAYIGRSIFGAFTLGLAGLILIVGAHTQDAVVASLLLAAGAGAIYLGQAVYYAVAADLGGRYAGVVSGMVSMCGQVAGAITATATPMLATRYGWEYAFYVASGVTFVCIIPWLFVNPSRGIYVPHD